MKKEFLEKYIYEKFKNYCFVNSEEFRKIIRDYELKSKIDVSKIWVNITKYQVSKYGSTLKRCCGVIGEYRWKSMKL